MDLGLQDWRVLVTGASNGIGQAIAQGFVDEGAALMACGRDPMHPVADGVAARIDADLTDDEAPDRVVRATVDQLGGLDTVVAAAGGAVTGTLEATPDQTWQEGVDLNLMSIVRLLRAAVPHLRQRGGRIVLLSALSAHEPRGNHVVSNVGKAGVRALGKTLSRELAEDDILVNCIAPGRIRSGQLDRSFPDDHARAEFSRTHIPLGRFGTADEAVPLALLLGSPRNTYITGQTVNVDGGMAWSA